MLKHGYKFILLILVLISFCWNPAQAAKKLDFSQFRKIIIVDEGRAKPLDTYARSLLLKFSGRGSIEGLNAIQWLALVIFEPLKANEQKLFLINNPEVVEALKIKPDAKRRYSFHEIDRGNQQLIELAQQAQTKEAKQLTPIENEFVRVFNNYNTYLNLISSFSLFQKSPNLMISEEARIKLQLESRENSLYNFLQKSNALSDNLLHINTNAALNNSDGELVRISMILVNWLESFRQFNSMSSAQNQLLIIPTLASSQIQWLNPWQYLISDSEGAKAEIKMLNNIYLAYISNNSKQFKQETKVFNQAVKNKLKLYKQKLPSIELELLYNALNPFIKAQLFYVLSLIALIFAYIQRRQQAYKASSILLWTAFALHSLGIVLRVLILQRPPVTNLYETFIFVSWICVAIGFCLSYLEKNSLTGKLLSLISGFLLLMISGKFASDGDTMKVLIAVLDSNFWLSTHVICVTIGYAGVFAAGVVGHIYLVQKKFFQELNISTGLILGMLGFGLCFSFLGTVLGGIWADQSWGRFWGWDPKENGALLIILWTAMIFHARLGALIRDEGLAVLSVLGCIVVMISWFGINLLGVGLHSYGFTSGIATGFFAYLAFELIFLAVVFGFKFKK